LPISGAAFDPHRSCNGHDSKRKVEAFIQLLIVGVLGLLVAAMTRKRYILHFSIGILLGFATACPAVSAIKAPVVLVDFNFHGTPVSVIGRRIGRHTYLFNEGAPKKVKITTLDWSPYIGETICDQGWVQQFTIALLATRGYEITSIFLPWARTVMMAETGLADVLYPEYYIEPDAPSDVIRGTKRIDQLAISRRFPGGPIAFMKRKGEPDYFKGNLLNLKGEKIGVVRGYQNTPKFDALMDMGFFNISPAVDDLMNVTKLVNHRINLIIGDPSVITYSVNESDLKPEQKRAILDQVEIVKPVIRYNYLYYAVSKKRPNWKIILADINAGINEFESSGLIFRIIQKAKKECGHPVEETLRPYANGLKGQGVGTAQKMRGSDAIK
jgi:polar amino acid transport system substrate-binding protein